MDERSLSPREEFGKLLNRTLPIEQQRADTDLPNLGQFHSLAPSILHQETEMDKFRLNVWLFRNFFRLKYLE